TKIVTPIRRGPMHRAGAKPGDLILKVNDLDVRDAGLAKVVSLLQGDEGTRVTVVVRQPGAKETRTLNITRPVIPVDMIVGYGRDGEGWTYRADESAPIAYVVVKGMTASTLHELRQVERRLKADGFKALVLDLRFLGSGGALAHAIQVTDGLLDGGV